MFMLSLSHDWLELRSNVVVRLSLLGTTEIGEAQAIVTCGKFSVTACLAASPGVRRSTK
jgi:hypothetical protein